MARGKVKEPFDLLFERGNLGGASRDPLLNEMNYRAGLDYAHLHFVAAQEIPDAAEFQCVPPAVRREFDEKRRTMLFRQADAKAKLEQCWAVLGPTRPFVDSVVLYQRSATDTAAETNIPNPAHSASGALYLGLQSLSGIL